jgi:hypothetical protein
MAGSAASTRGQDQVCPLIAAADVDASSAWHDQREPE